MTQFASNEEFFDAVRLLIDRWCDERQLRPLGVLLPSFLAFNGLADGWFELHAGLLNSRALGREVLSQIDWDILNDLIRAADAALHAMRTSERLPATPPF
jgi:hypothetical protein